MRYQWAERTRQGTGHEVNDDVLHIEKHEAFFCASVFDGMGGHQQGYLAAKTAADALGEMAASGELYWADAEGGFLRDLNRKVYERALEDGADRGSTAVVFLLRQDAADIWNIGDSRAYVIWDEKIQQLTKDHTEAQNLREIGERLGSPVRIPPSAEYTLSQYLGVDEQELYLEPEHVTIRPLEAGDRFILCTDGLTHVVPDEKILKIALEEKDRETCADALTAAALEAGSRDDISVIIIDIVS